MRKQYHLRTSPFGLLAWDVDRLISLTAHLPRVEVPLDSIRELDEPFWFGSGSEAATCRAVADHARLILESDLEYPIILGADGRVMDGMHRVAKAYLEGRSTILAVRLETNPDPDFVGVEEEALPYEEDCSAMPEVRVAGPPEEDQRRRSTRIRSVKAEDRAEWLRLLLGLYPHHPVSEHIPAVDAFLAGKSHDELIPAEVFVCERSSGGLSGFLELSARNYAEGCSGPVPHVESWYVDPDARGHGIGRLLMAAAEQWAKERGYREVASDAELDNLHSQNAHEALGFEEVERAVHFRKRL